MVREVLTRFNRDRKQLNDILTNKRVGMYAGVDPTGPSLHVGHVLPFMILAWGYVWGLPVTWLVSDVAETGTGKRAKEAD